MVHALIPAPEETDLCEFKDNLVSIECHGIWDYTVRPHVEKRKEKRKDVLLLCLGYQDMGWLYVLALFLSMRQHPYLIG